MTRIPIEHLFEAVESPLMMPIRQAFEAVEVEVLELLVSAVGLPSGAIAGEAASAAGDVEEKDHPRAGAEAGEENQPQLELERLSQGKSHGYQPRVQADGRDNPPHEREDAEDGDESLGSHYVDGGGFRLPSSCTTTRVILACLVELRSPKALFILSQSVVAAPTVTFG